MFESNRITNVISFFAGIVVTVVIASFVFNTPKKNTQEHVYLDIDRVIKEVTTDVINRKLSQEQAAGEVEGYKQKFDKELEIYAKEHNVVIFSSPKPIAGARDVTDYFINELIKDK